jgi:hypothetical protein
MTTTATTARKAGKPGRTADRPMTAIVSSLLASGGWELVVGWILPTALNGVLLGLLVLPAWHQVAFLHGAAAASNPVKALVLLAGAVVGGLVLSALQTPLYRILEGYRWPVQLQQRGVTRQRERKDALDARLRLTELTIEEDETERLNRKQAAKFARFWHDVRGPQPRPVQAWQGAAAQAKLGRYPIDTKQILPTTLGNAIRAFEEYGYDRYRLDVLVWWHALAGAAPSYMRRQAAASRAGVDFYVCLIFGHVVVALVAAATIGANPGHAAAPAVALVATVLLSFLWYKLAVEATDEWGAAVRALVEIGRKPLADSLGLAMPNTLESEREMWETASLNALEAHSDLALQINKFRVLQSQHRGP